MKTILFLGAMAITALWSIAARSPQASGQTSSVSASRLEPGAGADLVAQSCTTCHGAAKITNATGTKEQWSKIVRRMIDYGANVSDKDLDKVIDYLSTHYHR